MLGSDWLHALVILKRIGQPYDARNIYKQWYGGEREK